MLEGYNGNAFAVMYRTNAQSRALEEAFVQAGMPYRLVGATQFYQRREVKDIIAYLRVVHNPLDAVSFNRVLNVPTRGIGQQTQAQFMAWAADLGLQPAEALLWLVSDADAQHPFNGRAYGALSMFGNMLSSWITLRDRVSVGELLDAILEQINYRVYLDDGTEEGEERWANVMELRGVAAIAGGGSDGEMNLGDFLQQVALVAETDNLDAEAQATTLLTLHAAKGLEFPIVFITGLEEGLLPHSRSMDSEDELAEERRLFYVGLTRARDALYLSHAFRRTAWGDSSVAVPSRFLADIPEALVDGRRPGNRRRESIDRASMWNPGQVSWNDSARTRPSGAGRSGNEWPPSSAPAVKSPGSKRLPVPNDYADDPRALRPTAAQFKTGQKVRHSKFGEGTVIESKVTGGDEEVTVAFPGTGIKRLAASIAGLERIG